MNSFKYNYKEKITIDNLIIGSGAGGSTTAHELVKANQDFLIIEEGIDPNNNDLKLPGQFINKLYYNNGVTPMFCRNKGPIIGFGQGRCIGGSTYINAGYFSETPKYIFDKWKKEGSIDLDYNDYQKLIDEIKKEINISSPIKNTKDIDSHNIFESARHLNWKIEYCNRFVSENLSKDKCLIGDCSCDISDCPVHKKQSMNVTYLKDIITNNKILNNFKVQKIFVNNKSAKFVIAYNQKNKKRIKIFFKNLFVNCGPINSYGLLKKNNLLDSNLNSLNQFEFHLNFKVIVKFSSEVNLNLSKSSSFFLREFENEGVLFSTSNSEIPYLLASLSHYDPEILVDVHKNYKNYAMYVYQIKSYSSGRVLSSIGSSVVQYDFDKRDYIQLQLGIKRISKIFSNIGAEIILFPISNSGLIKSNKQALNLSNNFNPKDLHLISVHGMSTLRSSNNNSLGHTNLFGKLNNFNNIFINDASILPSNTGESPQATIMALAKKNVKNLKF